jgi:hypothetical protein
MHAPNLAGHMHTTNIKVTECVLTQYSFRATHKLKVQQFQTEKCVTQDEASIFKLTHY